MFTLCLFMRKAVPSGIVQFLQDESPHACAKKLNGKFTSGCRHESVKSLLNLIVHEMVHAYFFIMCAVSAFPGH